MIQSLAVLSIAAMLLVSGGVQAEPPGAPGQQEFGLSERELVQKIEQVEARIAGCMRAQGFEYVAVDADTVRRGMQADKQLPGLEEKDFVAKYGFGISTNYTGRAPQVSNGYSPGRIGLGRRNVQIFQGLSPTAQIAYSRALFGDHSDATFAIALDAEDFSRCGGCTLQAVEQVFDREQLTAAYYNPKDELIKRDPRMKAALREYAAAMRAAGFDNQDPDALEAEIWERLDAITGGSTVLLEELSQEQLAALEELQDYERRLATVSFGLEVKLLDPIEQRIERELYARRVE